jgi:hypothetical protein
MPALLVLAFNSPSCSKLNIKSRILINRNGSRWPALLVLALNSSVLVLGSMQAVAP